MTSPDATLPHWDVTTFFPSLEGREVAVAHESTVADLARLVALYDRHEVRGGEPRPPTEADLAAVDEVIVATNELLDQVRTLSAYLFTFIATDADNDRAAGLRSRLQTELTDLSRLTVRFDAWVARLGADALTRAGSQAADHAHCLVRAAAAAQHQMSEAEEGLAADLRLTGSSAWARLHGEVTSRLSATVAGTDGHPEAETLPITVVRGLAHHADPARRRAAYQAELVAWESVSVPLAAALNGAKGEANVVNRRRGWADAVAPALFTNAVDPATLDAMHEAVDQALPDFRRYLRAKAAWLGHGDGSGGLAWWDLFAPVGTAVSDQVDWPDALGRVRGAFAGFSPTLAGLVDRAETERWIDAEPRSGKQGGAFCMPMRGGESRVMVNFDGSLDSVRTLAHELGHAYHNTNLAERTPMQRQTPMALAETASIFCETIMVEAALAATPIDQRLGLLDSELQASTQVVVDIRSRFLFEQELCQRRERQTLSVTELCELMTDAQRRAYGDGLDPEALHPWMWAVKGHYFTPFYNWPYTYGLLFGIGLYAGYRQDPERFKANYDTLLSMTGMDDAAGLGARFGIDVRDVAFWTSSLDVLRTRIDDFVALAVANPAG